MPREGQEGARGLYVVCPLAKYGLPGQGEGNSAPERANIPGMKKARPRGRPPHPDVLTPAEWTVVHGVRHGMSNRTIARLCAVSLDAVKFHVSNAKAKLGLSDRDRLRHWRGVPADSALVQNSRKDGAVSTLELGPIGQIARAVKDLKRAEAWYRDVLGLTHLYTFEKLAFFDCGGTRLMIEDQSIIEVPDLHNDSVLYFRVPDIQGAYEELRSRGAEFTGAPHLIYKHGDGTEEWMAFFKDSEGKHLALMSQVKRP
jgi:DNA-binding CsgD family transcriptional regulator/predicted enzyme related to lactoylglutathione lyase